MSLRPTRRTLIVGLGGAAVAVLATLLFDLRVHIGMETITGPARLLAAAGFGAFGAVIIDYAVRETWPFWP